MRINNFIFIIIIIGWQLQTSVYCQSLYFNKTIDLAGEWGSGMSIIADDSTYHIAAITGPGKMISIVEMSLSGEQKWIRKYGNPQENWYPGNPGSFCPFLSGGYILGGGIETPDSYYGLLLRFDPLFDTTFSTRYINSNYTLILTCAKPTFDGGIIFTGEDYTSGSTTDFILLKADSLGNELWRTIKNIGYDDRGWSIIQTPDSGFVVGGYTYNPGAYHTGDPLIVKFDKNGTFLWNRNPGGPYQDGKAMVCLNEDSTITVLTTIADSIYVFDFDYARICVIKYSQNGDELWKKKYGESIGGNFVWNIRLLPNGGYICCGQQQEPGNNDFLYFGWLLRLDSDGDSIWFRRYSYNNVDPFYNNELMDVSLAQDGGFIATGEVWDDDPPNGLQKIWVLKVDSIGCDSAGCDTTVGIKEQHGGMEAWGHGGMEIWPNPAREQIHGRLSMDRLSAFWRNGRLNRDLTLVIYDIFGRKVQEIKNIDMQREFQVGLESFSPGIYIIILKNGLNIVESRKFVVAR
jgi:hypothetical protein